MTQDNKNLYLAIVLSILVIIGWSYLYGSPKIEKARESQTQSQTVGALITETKLAEVSRLLKATQTPIASIPSLCGFRNANALKNLFKRRFGASMRAFRNGA